MRNLKRALSLALASIMLLGMMVVGTSAASINDFTDADQIGNKEAVSIATGLGIFDGYDDGSFGPDRVVTRAEMAVVICKILHGADVNPGNFAGVSKFTDVPAWAEGYVNMCSALGIIEGYGDGKFGPNDTVTTVQAATMLLKALGYFQKDTSGALGTDWTLEVTSMANALGLYGDLALSINAGLTRENVAELTFNTLFAQRVAFDDYRGLYVKSNDRSVVVTNGTVDANNTLAQNTFGLYVVEGTVTANGYTDAVLEGKLGDEDLTAVSFEESVDLDHDGKLDGDSYDFEYTTGLDMIGHAVDVYYKVVKGSPVVFTMVDQATLVETISYNGNTARLADAANDAGFKKNTILDIDADKYFVNYDMGVTVADVADTISSATITTTGTPWADGSRIAVDTNGVLRSVEEISGTIDTNNVANKNLVVISNSGNYNVDYVIVLDQALDVVDNIEDDKDFTEYTLTVNNGDDMNVTEATVAEGEYVITTDIGLKGEVLYFQPAETVSATITKLTGKTDATHTITGVTADGENYTKSKAYANDGASKLDEILAFADIDKTGATVLVLDQFGKLIAIESKKGAPNYAYVAEYGIRHSTTDTLNTKMALTAKVYFADGTSGVYEVDIVDSSAMATAGATTAMLVANYDALKGALNGAALTTNTIVDKATTASVGSDTVTAARGLYNVNVDSDGITIEIDELTTEVTEAYAADVKLVKAHSTLLDTTTTPITNVETTAIQYDSIGGGIPDHDSILYQNADTVYFYINLDGTDLTVQTVTGIKNAKGFTNGTHEYNSSLNADTGIQEAFASQVGIRAVMDTMLITCVELANDTTVYYHDENGYDINDIGGGKHTITFFMYNNKTGAREDVTYDNNGKYWSASAALTHVQSKEDGWYTLGANDIKDYAAVNNSFDMETKSTTTYITNDTAGYDEYADNLFGQSSLLGAILDMDTVIVKDICGSGLTTVNKLVNAVKNDGDVSISFTWNSAYETFVVFVTAYAPDSAEVPGGTVGVYGFDGTLIASAGSGVQIDTTTLTKNGTAGDTSLTDTGNLTVSVSLVNGGTTVNLGTQTVKNITITAGVLSEDVPGFTLAAGNTYLVTVTFTNSNYTFSGTYSLSI